MRLRLGVLFLALAFGLPLFGQTEDAVDLAANPGRPTIATPATLTPVGYVQFETGILVASHSPEFSSSTSLNEVMKLSVTPRFEFIVSANPFEHAKAQGIEVNGAADVFLGGQAVVRQGEGARPTIAVSYFRHVYDGQMPDLDIGSARNSVLLLASADVKGFHYDANFMFNEQTQIGVQKMQWGQTLSLAHALRGKFSITAEFWHFTQPLVRGNAAGTLWAVGYTPRKTVVLDVGFNRGMTDTSTRWQVFAGVTYLVPHRLWPKAAQNSIASPGCSGLSDHSE